MKIGLILFLVFTISLKLKAQFINPGFEDWDTIQTIGQPFENPVGWKTNNQTDHTGFASTPVTKELNTKGLHARIESNAQGIDEWGPGELMQTISVENLEKIGFNYKCDSIYKLGKCIISVLDPIQSQILYTDTILTTTSEFQSSIIDIQSEWLNNTDSITLKFEANGYTFDLEPEIEGYSVLLVDNIKAQYITGVQSIPFLDDVTLYPNPSSGIFKIDAPQSLSLTGIDIHSLTGDLIRRQNFSNLISLEGLPSGAYFIHFTSNRYSGIKLVFVLK